MPYFPTTEERAYRCHGCGGWFVPSMMSCTVAHPPGTCCHHYERAVPMQIQRITGRESLTPNPHGLWPIKTITLEAFKKLYE